MSPTFLYEGSEIGHEDTPADHAVDSHMLIGLEPLATHVFQGPEFCTVSVRPHKPLKESCGVIQYEVHRTCTLFYILKDFINNKMAVPITTARVFWEGERVLFSDTLAKLGVDSDIELVITSEQ